MIPESPAYVLDLGALCSRCADLEDPDRWSLSYSVKTLPVAEALRAAHERSWTIEVVSEAEYAFATECGIPGAAMILNGPAKSESVLARALVDGARIHADSMAELETVCRLSREQSRGASTHIGLRLGLGVTDPVWARFGIDVSDEAGALRRIGEISQGIPICGFHVHSGTNRSSRQDFMAIVARLIRFVQLYSSFSGHSVGWLDLGGGFADPCVGPTDARHWHPPATKDFFADAARLLEELWEGERPEIIFEPGRSLVGNCVRLFCRVEDVKNVGGVQVATLDAGVNTLPFARHFDYPVELVEAREGELLPTVLCGPLCMSDDILCADVSLPGLMRGDGIVFNSVGSYNVAMAFDFIRPRARLVVRDGPDLRDARRMFDP